MTTAQRREYKKANQARKAIILHNATKGPKEERHYWGGLGVIQNGKYTK